MKHALLISFFVIILLPMVFAAFDQQYKEVPLTYFNEKGTPQSSRVTEPYFLAKIPLDDKGQASYALVPTAKKDIMSRKVRYADGNLIAYNPDGSVYAELVGLRTVRDKGAVTDAKNQYIETHNGKGELTEKLYADDDGRVLRMPYQQDRKVTALLYDPSAKRPVPVSPDAATYVLERNPQNGLALLQSFGKTQPGLLTAVEKDGLLVDNRNNQVHYELEDDALVATRTVNNVAWGIRTSPDGKKDALLNGYAVNENVAAALEQTYGADITSFDGRTAIAGDRSIVIGDDAARVLQGGTEIERISLVMERGVQKTAIERQPMTGGYQQRELRWIDSRGTHKSVEKNDAQGLPTQADEELVDGKGNKYYIRTDFANGKPSLSMQYDTSGYPVARIKYDTEGNPVPEQSTVIEYVTPHGKVCDPTRDYLCTYQKVDMRIRVGKTIVSDACRAGDKGCRTVASCTSDPTCNQVYGETLRAYQRSNLGIALNNAYLAARSAEFFNVKNFDFIDKLFSSQFGSLMLGEPSFGYCGQFTKRTSDEGVLVSDTRMKTLLAYVGGERTTTIHPNKTKEYLYKLNYFVDAQVEDITFNVDLYRGSTMIISLFIEDAKIPKGQRTSARGQQSIVQYSNNFYDKICLRSNKGMTCNRIIETTELPLLPETVPVQGVQRGGRRAF